MKFTQQKNFSFYTYFGVKPKALSLHCPWPTLGGFLRPEIRHVDFLLLATSSFLSADLAGDALIGGVNLLGLWNPSSD